MYPRNKLIKTTSLIGAFVFLSLSRVTHGQCPQICDAAQNTALGNAALSSLTNGSENTAVGVNALIQNTDGSANTANGAFALESNTTGNSNTGIGWYTLASNTSGTENTSVGLFALPNNTLGNDNTAIGAYALNLSTIGTENTANGVNALGNNTTGSRNIALGRFAGYSLTTGSDNIDIGNMGAAGESRTIRIGTSSLHRATYVAGIHGATIPTGIPVLVDTKGHLGTTTSSSRFKDAIKPMDKASESILSLQPVTFCYKHELDPEGIPQFGLVAEQVEKVNPDLVARDEQGKPYTVRYEAVNAMLLNEFLKEHRTVRELRSTVAKQDAAIAQQQSANVEQQKEIQALTAALKAQAAQIQKVSDQLRTHAAAPRVVADN